MLRCVVARWCVCVCVVLYVVVCGAPVVFVVGMFVCALRCFVLLCCVCVDALYFVVCKWCVAFGVSFCVGACCCVLC